MDAEPTEEEQLSERLSDDPEVPEADALEQARSVEVEPEPARPSSDPEVPEADAWEQAQEVPFDDPT